MTRSILLTVVMEPSLAAPPNTRNLVPSMAMVAEDDTALAAELAPILNARGPSVIADDPALLSPTAGDFVGTGFNGAVMDLPAWIDIHFAPGPGFERFTPSRILAWRLNPDTAVAIGWRDMYRGDTATDNPRDRFTAVFRQATDGWREVLYHETANPFGEANFSQMGRAKTKARHDVPMQQQSVP